MTLPTIREGIEDSEIEEFKNALHDNGCTNVENGWNECVMFSTLFMGMYVLLWTQFGEVYLVFDLYECFDGFKEKVDTPQELNLFLTHMRNVIESSAENTQKWNEMVVQITYYDENYNDIVRGLMPHIKPS